MGERARSGSPVDAAGAAEPGAATLALTADGGLALVASADAQPVDAEIAERLARIPAGDSGALLLTLGAERVRAALPPVPAWWRAFAGRYLASACTLPDAERAAGRVAPPDDGELQALAWSAPPMDGGEHLSPAALAALWRGLDAALHARLAGRPLGEFLRERDAAWHVVGRVHLHLAENRRDEEFPFAFLATYATRLSAQGQAQHRPLGEALREYAGTDDRQRLVALLEPLQRAGAACPWLKALVDGREIFRPLRWSVAEAAAFLRDAPALEQAGLVVRMPASWRAGRPPRATARASVGARPPSTLGQAALLDFAVDVALDGEPLDQAETRALLAADAGLALIRGRWVAVDAEGLRAALDRLREAERVARADGLGFHEAMRLVAGAGAAFGDEGIPASGSVEVRAGPWLGEALAGLRSPERLATLTPGADLRATLRPYQAVGLRWLHLVSGLRLGAVLADDMGLGKTIQVIALLLVRARAEGRAPSLLVAPASLIANWRDEAARFAPGLSVLVAHASAMPADELAGLTAERIASADLVVTTYGSLHRFAWIARTPWRLAIFDEAQALKNPGTRQTRAAKALRAASRLALTGTPIENRLGDLWSIFDVVAPGLLGGAKAFAAFTRRLAESPDGYAPLRRLVQPYILRRLKTDRAVIADLPDKTEQTAWCALSRRQAALYQQAVQELADALATKVDGVARKGLVLAFLTRFKQICNHPSHWLGDDAWSEADSGKFARLREIVEVIAAKREKALVFTQFAELCAPLAGFLGALFGRGGCVLTGATPVRERATLVERFQQDAGTPFFVLSLKAGGSGLNLTAASHVIHVDRWWNPAVEAQATDRAFRIGQRRSVCVHAFVCRGTVEERIAALLADKKRLAADLLDAGDGEARLTELPDDELLRLVRLDLDSAVADG